MMLLYVWKNVHALSCEYESPAIAYANDLSKAIDLVCQEYDKDYHNPWPKLEVNLPKPSDRLQEDRIDKRSLRQQLTETKPLIFDKETAMIFQY
jgi:hypothetical protein